MTYERDHGFDNLHDSCETFVEDLFLGEPRPHCEVLETKELDVGVVGFVPLFRHVS